MTTNRDLLTLPAKAFFRDKPQYSLILATAKLDDFIKLYYLTSTSWSSLTSWSSYYNNVARFLHFSTINCNSKSFRKRDVLTVNMKTGNWCWRKPYSIGTYP